MIDLLIYYHLKKKYHAKTNLTVDIIYADELNSLILKRTLILNQLINLLESSLFLYI